MLIGTNQIPALSDIGGKQVQLGDIVAAAHTASGLSVTKWNKLPGDERDMHIQVQLEQMHADAKSDEAARLEADRERTDASLAASSKLAEDVAAKVVADALALTNISPTLQADALKKPQLVTVAEQSRAEAEKAADDKRAARAEFDKSLLAKLRVPAYGEVRLKARLSPLRDPYQNVWFDTGDGAVTKLTPWVKAQVNANLLVPVTV